MTMDGRLSDEGVPDDIKWLGSGLSNIAHWTHKVYDVLRRQESPNPTVINLNPGFTWTTTAKMRAFALSFSGGTAGNNLGLRVGSAVAWDWIVPASPGPFTLPLPLVLDAGVDITVVDLTAPGSTNWRCRVVAYTEVTEGE